MPSPRPAARTALPAVPLEDPPVLNSRLDAHRLPSSSSWVKNKDDPLVELLELERGCGEAGDAPERAAALAAAEVAAAAALRQGGGVLLPLSLVVEDDVEVRLGV